MSITQKDFKEMFAVAEKNEKISKMIKRFNELKENNFRVHARYDNLSIRTLAVIALKNQEASILKKELRRIDKIDTTEEGFDFMEHMRLRKECTNSVVAITTQIHEIKELMQDEAKYNLKVEVTSHKNHLMFTLDGSRIALTTLVVAGGAKSDQKTTTVPNECVVKEKFHFIATKALKTAFSDANDFMFYNLHLDKGSLELTATNIKDGNVRYYGILGHKGTIKLDEPKK